MFRAFTTSKKNFLLLLIGLFGICEAIYGQQGGSSYSQNYDRAVANLKINPEAALGTIDSILLYGGEDFKQSKADVLLLKAEAFSNLGKKEEALSLCSQALELFQPHKDGHAIIDAYLFKGSILSDLGRGNEAIEYFSMALKDAKSLKDTFNIIEAYIEQAKYYSSIADYGTALNRTIQAEKYAKDQDDVFSQKIAIFSTYGVLYHNLNEYDKSIEYNLKGIKMAEKKKNFSMLFKFHINIASVFKDDNNIEKAEFHFKKSYELANESEDLDKIAYAESYLGDFYLTEKKYHKAIPLFEKSLARLEAMNNVYEAAYTLGTLGIAQVGVGNKTLGLRQMMKADTMISEVDFEVYKESLYKIMAESCYDFGYHKLGFDFYEKHVASKDKIRTEANQNKILEVKTQFETQEKEQEIEFLTNEKKVKDKLTLLSIFSTILLLFVVLMLYNSRKLMEKKNQAMEKAKLYAEKTAMEKAEFLATMTHEIRTPMNGVIGIANILAEENPRPDQSENLELLRFSADNLLNLINDILDLAKIEAGKITLENNNFDVKKYCIKTHCIFKTINKKSNVDIELDLDLDDLSYQLKGDVMRINQVMSNLLNNALKFTERGTITIKATKVDEDKKTARIKFEIIDTGLGISNEKQKTIFNKYEQATTDTSRKYGGTGLGLNICKEIIKLHDSELKLTSELGVGSNFFFEIEFEKSEKRTIENKVQIEHSKSDFTGLKILLAEDNKVNQLVAKRILTNWGVKLAIAENGLEALKYVKSQDFDLILMDIQMPVMDGYLATAKIRALSGKKGKIPILAMTASQISDVKSEVQSNKMNGYIGKPFNPKKLAEAISKHVVKFCLVKNDQLN